MLLLCCRNCSFLNFEYVEDVEDKSELTVTGVKALFGNVEHLPIHLHQQRFVARHGVVMACGGYGADTSFMHQIKDFSYNSGIIGTIVLMSVGIIQGL